MVPIRARAPAVSVRKMWPPVAINVSSGTATMARIQGRMKPSTAWPTTGMREAAGSATAFSWTPASDCFSAVAESTSCSRSTASEHSMQEQQKAADRNRQDDAPARRGQEIQLGEEARDAEHLHREDAGGDLNQHHHQGGDGGD